ncbi:MAG: methyltransferase cognate corrinoid protein [Spirochaetales bacterium]|nr:methyltransferase cognate corrinoid protein [Spirochaetales bacterium]
MIANNILTEAHDALFAFDAGRALATVQEVVSKGEDPLELLDNAFIPAINEIGELFGTGEMFLPELIQAAEVMKQVTAAVTAALPKDQAAGQAKGAAVLGTVEGDIHDIGKTLVVTMLGIHGVTVHDLGRDIPIDTFIEKAKETGAKVIGTSALLTTTMTKQKELEEALKEAGLKGKIRTIVGGAPVTRRWAERIGADAYGENAHEASVQVEELLKR